MAAAASGVAGPAIPPLLGTALLGGYYSALGRLRFAKVRFDFAFPLALPHPEEWVLAAQVSVWAVLKYALVPGLIVVLSRRALRAHPEAGRRTAALVAGKALVAGAFVAIRLRSPLASGGPGAAAAGRTRDARRGCHWR